MKDHLQLGYLGLSDDQVNALKSIFNLSVELREAWALVELSEISKADVVLVNLDESEGIMQWTSLSRINRMVVPITLSATDNSITGIPSLKLPIRLSGLKEALMNTHEFHG